LGRNLRWGIYIVLGVKKGANNYCAINF